MQRSRQDFFFRVSQIRKFGITKIYACRTLANPEGIAIYRLTRYRYFARVLSAHAFRKLRYFTQTIATDHTIFVIVFRASLHKIERQSHTTIHTSGMDNGGVRLSPVVPEHSEQTKLWWGKPLNTNNACPPPPQTFVSSERSGATDCRSILWSEARKPHWPHSPYV